MHLRTHHTLRSLTALFLALGFGLFTTESLIADVHDGDADRGHVVSVEGPDAHQGGGTNPADGSETPSHAAHVCHCVHAHAGVTSDAPSLSVIEPVRTLAPTGDARQFASIDREPQLRPPIL